MVTVFFKQWNFSNGVLYYKMTDKNKIREIKLRNHSIMFVLLKKKEKTKQKTKNRHTLFRNERALFPLGRLVLKTREKTNREE